MKLILNNYLQQSGKNKSFKQAAALCFFSDLLLVFYIARTMLPKILNLDLMKQVLAIQGVNIKNLNPQYAQELIAVMRTSSYSMLCTLILYNVIIYILFIKQKKWAVSYVKGYTLSAAVLSVFEFAAPLFTSYRPSLETLITFFAYSLAFYTILYFKKNPEK